MKKETRRELTSYVSRNVLSTLGTSLYILADTFFIANGVGPYGLTALNLALPLFNLITGLGLLLGMGGATLFSLNKIHDPQSGKKYFSQLLIVGALVGLIFTCTSFFLLDPIANLLGGSPETTPFLKSYLLVILMGAPFFLLNNLVLSFVRNDGNPQLTMAAMLGSSIFNIIFDYIFVFPLGMGMFGAALATLFSPILSLLILSLHRKKAGRLLGIEKSRPKFSVLTKSIQLGMPSFLTEMSTGVSILVFNIILLSLVGDIAVAAYGILANIFLVGTSMFTGTAQGIQPIVSREFGRRNYATVNSALRFGLLTSFSLGAVLYGLVWLFRLPVIQIFNSSNNQELVHYALTGIPIYLLSFLFSGTNIVITIFLSSIAKAKKAFIIVLLRGYLLIIPLIFLFGKFFGVLGVWLSLPITELITLMISASFIYLLSKNYQVAKRTDPRSSPVSKSS